MTTENVTETLGLLEKIFRMYPDYDFVENDGKDRVSFATNTMPTQVELAWYCTLINNFFTYNNTKVMFAQSYRGDGMMIVTFIVKGLKKEVKHDN